MPLSRAWLKHHSVEMFLVAVQTPKIPMPPAWEEGWKLQDEQPVKRELYDTLAQMITVMNEAVGTLPVLDPMPS